MHPRLVHSIWRGPIKAPIWIETFAKMWCADRCVDLADLRGPERHLPLAHIRQEFMVDALTTGYSSTRIGAYLHRDHATILYGRKAVTRRAAS